jgi:hypothetical protein
MLKKLSSYRAINTFHLSYKNQPGFSAFSKLRNATIRFVMSVRVHLSARNNSAHDGRNLNKFDISAIFEKLSSENSHSIKI